MTQERIERLFSCRSEQGFDSISYDKRKILEDLYKDSDIIEILNNKELQAVNACPEDYYNVNIYSFLKIPDGFTGFLHNLLPLLLQFVTPYRIMN